MAKYRNITSWKPGRSYRKDDPVRVKHGDCKLTICIGRRVIGGRGFKTFEILEIERESRRGNYYIDSKVKSTGFLIEMVDAIEWHVYSNDLAECIWMDTVINEFLPKWLKKHGYTQHHYYDWPPCFYKVLI